MTKDLKTGIFLFHTVEYSILSILGFEWEVVSLYKVADQEKSLEDIRGQNQTEEVWNKEAALLPHRSNGFPKAP